MVTKHKFVKVLSCFLSWYDLYSEIYGSLYDYTNYQKLSLIPRSTTSERYINNTGPLNILNLSSVLTNVASLSRISVYHLNCFSLIEKPRLISYSAT